MTLIPDSIPTWVWVVVLVACAASAAIKGLAHRRTLVAAASAPGAGEAEQKALKKQAIGGLGMTLLLGGILLAFLLPSPYGLITMPVGIAACWICVFALRRV